MSNFVDYDNANTIFTGFANEIKAKQNIMQFSEMPVYSSVALGTIVQYTGASSANYINGYFYKRGESGWVNVKTQETSIPIHFGESAPVDPTNYPLWIDTANGYILNVYNGTNWIAPRSVWGNS